ncbi:MAG TPA: ATPase [Alphaproteobacteria bacterium]|nr:ATPase [Alphaproteobacteria bacterium]
MRITARAFRDKPLKAVTLIGMSGVGKSHTACNLARWGWHNYSCDWLIGTRYLKDAVRQDGALSPDNIAGLSDFVGQIGNPAKGGVGLEEFRRRQRLYYEAECAVLRDIDAGLESAAQKGRSFVNDSSGSLCEVEDETILEHVGSKTLFVYLKAAQEDHPKILERAVLYPKPLYFPPAFFDAHLKDYLDEFGIGDPELIDPGSFLSWVFPRLFRARLPKYQALADRYGVTVPAGSLSNARSENEFLDLIAQALE